MILLDTNIILRFILNDDKILSPKAKAIFQKIAQGKIEVYLSLLAIAEVVFTLERSYKLPKAEIANRILTIADTPNITIERQELLKEIFSYHIDKNISFIDAYHVALMNKKKIKQIYSFDKDFDKFKNIIRKEIP